MNPIFFQDPTETGEAATEQVVQTEEAVADNNSDHQDVTDNLDDQQNQVTTLLSTICNSFVQGQERGDSKESTTHGPKPEATLKTFEIPPFPTKKNKYHLSLHLILPVQKLSIYLQQICDL